MMLGVFLIFVGGGIGGKIALMLYEHRRPAALRYGWVISSIAAVAGAMLDTSMQAWAYLRVISFEHAFDIRYLVGTYAAYVACGAYLTAAVYYKRVIPFTLWARARMRRRP